MSIHINTVETVHKEFWYLKCSRSESNGQVTTVEREVNPDEWASVARVAIHKMPAEDRRVFFELVESIRGDERPAESNSLTDQVAFLIRQYEIESDAVGTDGTPGSLLRAIMQRLESAATRLAAEKNEALKRAEKAEFKSDLNLEHTALDEAGIVRGEDYVAYPVVQRIYLLKKRLDDAELKLKDVRDGVLRALR